MTVRYGVLAILSQGDCHGYQLKQEFELRTGGSWPLNVAQVYSTLERLSRDGLVAEAADRDDGTRIYRLTDAGAAAVERWVYGPDIAEPNLMRDELPTKIALALTLPGIDVPRAVQAHRHAAVAQLQDLTRLKRDRHRLTGPELGWELTLDAAVFAVRSRIQWLDHAEAKINRARRDSVELAYGLRDDHPRRGRPRLHPATDPTVRAT